MKPTTEQIKSIISEMERLGESKYFTSKECEQLERFFGTIDFGYLGWVHYYDASGESHYVSEFSPEIYDTMFKMYETRIDSIKKTCEALYEDFTLKKCVDIVNSEIERWKHKENEQRIQEYAMNCHAAIENGKLVLESNVPNYECIVIRHGKGYSGLIKIVKQHNGYLIDCNTPLGGGMYCEIEKDEIIKALKECTIRILC